MKRLSTIALFPGQGSQISGLCKDYYENFIEARDVFNIANSILKFNVLKFLEDSTSNDTEKLQPALLAAQFSIFETLAKHRDFKPDLAVGHSLGEFSAVTCARSFSFEQALKIASQRGKWMREASDDKFKGSNDSPAMAVFFPLSVETAEKLCAEVEGAEVGNINTFDQITLSGSKSALEQLKEIGKQKFGVRRVSFLNVSAPFHTTTMLPVKQKLKELIEKSAKDADFFILSNYNSALLRTSGEIEQSLINQTDKPVQFNACIQSHHFENAEVTVEIGGNILTPLVQRITSAKNMRLKKSVFIANVQDLDKL